MNETSASARSIDDMSGKETCHETKQTDVSFGQTTCLQKRHHHPPGWAFFEKHVLKIRSPEAQEPRDSDDKQRPRHPCLETQV